ncbi:MAG: lipid II flippase Amj family protein [Carboxydocellales bacterium]
MDDLTIRLIIVCVMTTVIHLINTLNYSVRLAGVRTKRLAIAFSLFNVIFLISSTANTVQAPLLAKISDKLFAGVERGSYLYSQNLVSLSWDIRLVLACATIGTVVGTFLIPSFVRIMSKGIFLFERTGSIPLLLGLLFSPGKLRKVLAGIYLPKSVVVNQVKRQEIPKKLLALNVLIVGVFTTGVLSALYAGSLVPEFGKTAAMLSSLVNGGAQILLATIVDPTVANITDQSIRGARSEEDVKSMVMYLAFSRIAGTILAQLIFIPAAQLIRLVAHFI